MKIKKVESKIPFDFVTVKTTKSRIEKGLLAIPVSLIDLFPKNVSKITLQNEVGKEEVKSFTPYNSNSRECRIGGLKEFYLKNKIKDGDELVIQLLDAGKFKIIPERYFEKQVLDLEMKIEKSDNEAEADKLLDAPVTIILPKARLIRHTHFFYSKNATLYVTLTPKL